MAIRVHKLLRETNIGLQTLDELLKALDFNETIGVTTIIPDNITNVILSLCNDDVDFLRLIEKNANKNVLNKQSPNFPIKIIGKQDLDGGNNSNCINEARVQTEKNLLNIIKDHSVLNTPQYDENNSMFWVEELMLLSSKGNAYRLPVAKFDKCKKEPLYSVIIGSNGAGKSHRWWHNRWKYQLVYNEKLAESFWWLARNRMKASPRPSPEGKGDGTGVIGVGFEI